MNYEKGMELIDLYKKIRKEINHTKQVIENANFRLSHSHSDEMWQKIKKEHETELSNATTRLDIVIQEFNSLKPSFNPTEKQQLLERLGRVIAETESFPHISDSLYDEHDLKKALDTTSSAIIDCYDKLDMAKANSDDDSITIITGQLKFYENDMQKHHWGVNRLQALKEAYITPQEPIPNPQNFNM